MPNVSLELSKAVFNTRYFSFRQGGSDAVDDLELLFGGMEHCRSDYRIERSGFPVYLLEYILRGEGELVLNGRTEQVRGGSLFWYGPGIPCRLVNNPERPLVKVFVAFQHNTGSLAEAYGLKRHYLRPNRGGEVVGKWCQLVLEEALSGEALAQATATDLLRIALRKCGQSEAMEAYAREPAWQVFRKAKAYIEDNYLEVWRLQQVSAAMGVDISYISRLFKRYYHTTPYTLLLQRKMDYALELLQSQELSVQRVAELVGFTDPFHFSRTFKKIQGINPSRIRGY
jgi:AraC-like DNA-binding protein